MSRRAPTFPPVPVGARRALVVDDSVFARSLVRRALESAGWTVVEAADGADAVPILARQGFDLVVTDLFMDRVSGTELIRTARRLLGPSAPPFLLLSSLEPEALAEVARSVRAEAWVSKPFDYEAFLALAAETAGLVVCA